ncbi:hypothetical protein Rs2_35773 [Raphanus sativus]|nr:hypothetical protein Rs2_35773 [Raphanus sativus]
MVYDLGKRVEIIQNVLGVKVTDGSPSDDNEDHQNAANSDYAKSSPSYDNEEEANSRVKICATDDENGEEICDEVEISDTHQLTQVNTLGENENTEKITSDEETEKMEEESCSKQKSKVTSSTPTFTTPNFETRVTSPTPTFTTPKFDILSQESRHSGKGANEVNDDVEPPLKKKKKADIAIAVEEYYWLGIVVNLEKRSITAFNSAAVKFTEANVGAYLNAYATVLPFMLRNVFRDVTMDASKFSIKIVSDGLPQKKKGIV